MSLKHAPLPRSLKPYFLKFRFEPHIHFASHTSCIVAQHDAAREVKGAYNAELKWRVIDIYSRQREFCATRRQLDVVERKKTACDRCKSAAALRSMKPRTKTKIRRRVMGM